MIQLDVISGFFSAGKSTLIQDLINTVYRDTSTAILINEIGKVHLTDSVFHSAGNLIKEIPTGCICCDRQDILIQTLSDLIKDGKFDHIILEPSGTARLADLIPFLQDMLRESTPQDVRLSHIVYVVDASSYKKRMLLSEGFFRSQLKNSPLVFLNRQEAIGSEASAEIREDIKTISPDCNFLSPDLNNWQTSVLDEAISYARHTLPIFGKYQKAVKNTAFDPTIDFSHLPIRKNR